MAYERALNIAPVLEDVYTGNVTSFNKRLSKEATIETVSAIYFIVSTIVIALAIFKAGVDDWIALIIFGFFTFGTVSRSVKLIKAKTELKRNPDREQCMEIAEETYELDYASYYEARNSADYNHIMPEKPKYFKVFQICSTIISAICTLLGAAYIILGIILFLGSPSKYRLSQECTSYMEPWQPTSASRISYPASVPVIRVNGLAKKTMLRNIIESTSQVRLPCDISM